MAAFFSKTKAPKSNCSAVIVAAGSGERMQGINKLFALIDGNPVLLYSLLAFENSEYINEIIVVSRETESEAISKMADAFDIKKLKKIIRGGDKRQDSVFIGLMEVSPQSEVVAIHDGARPLVTQKVIKEAVKAIEKYEGAAPGVPVKDTIKAVKSSFVTETPDRTKLFSIQTPQVFRTNVIKASLTDAINNGANLTDDCMALERLGISVRITEGDYGNIKITTPSDIAIAEAILRERKKDK